VAAHSAAARLPVLLVRSFFCCECCVLSGRSLCDQLITRPEESYRLWYVVVMDLENQKWEDSGPHWVAAPQEKLINGESNWTTIITRFSNVTQFVTCVFSNCLFLHVNVLQNYKFCNKSLLVAQYLPIFQEIYVTNKHVYNARIEVFIAVAVKIRVFWDMTPCPLLHSCRRFGEYLWFQIHYISCWNSICTQNWGRNEGSKLLQDYHYYINTITTIWYWATFRKFWVLKYQW